MKRILTYSLLLLTATACGERDNYAAAGTFEATEVTISAEATGRILCFSVEEGDNLTAQQSIGAIDTTQLYLQKMQLMRQRASVDSNRPDIAKQVASLQEQISKQRIEYQRVETLLKSGAATTKQLDDMQTQLIMLEKQLEAQLSTLHKNSNSIGENSSAIDLQIAQINDKLSKCYIISPIQGVVLAKYAETGELASVGRPLMKVAKMDRIYLRAYFTSDQLLDIKLGQNVTIVADFGGDAQRTYPGRITWIASESQFTPKTIQTRDSRANLVYAVKVAVENDGVLKLGMHGEVKL